MKSNGLKILVVEDDPPIRNLVGTTLETQDYAYEVAENGERAIQKATTNTFDIILLDLGLPDIDGVELIKKIRSWSMIPIIVISARSDDKDKIMALDAGADDYLTKPFSVEELLARVRATHRRVTYLASHSGTEEVVFQNGDLVIDYGASIVKVADQEVHLMPIEYGILCLLARNVGKVLTHHYILDKVWTHAIESDLASLRVYVASLRKKIDRNHMDMKYIQTHIGVGYRMVKIENE